MKKLILSVALLTIAAAPVDAGVVYVPLPGYGTVGQYAVQPRLIASNKSTGDWGFRHLFLPADTDGTKRVSDTSAYQGVQAGTTANLEPTSSLRGLIEVASAPQLVWAAELIQPAAVPERLTHLPVITSETLLDADQVTNLQGWARSNDLLTDLVLVNLGHAQAFCTIAVFRADGSQIASTATLTLLPLSSRTFLDALQLLGELNEVNVRSEISCDQPYFAFALQRNLETGSVTYLGPSEDGSSTLEVPGGPGPSPSCENGAVCFDLPGLVHQPAKGSKVRRLSFPVPPGQYDKIHLQIDVTVGPWGNPASGLHNLFWLAKDRNFNLYGYVNFHGPGRNDLLWRHGIGVTAPEKAKVVVPFNATVGATYHFDYLYDTAAHRITLTVSEGGRELVTLTDPPNVRHVNVDPGEGFLIDLGFNGENPLEPPTIGWQYRNIHLEFIP